MKRDHIIYIGAVCSIITLAVMIAAGIKAWLEWKAIQPQVTAATNAAGNSGKILSAFGL